MIPRHAILTYIFDKYENIQLRERNGAVALCVDVLSGGTQRRALFCNQSEEIKNSSFFRMRTEHTHVTSTVKFRIRKLLQKLMSRSRFKKKRLIEKLYRYILPYKSTFPFYSINIFYAHKFVLIILLVFKQTIIYFIIVFFLC